MNTQEIPNSKKTAQLEICLCFHIFNTVYKRALHLVSEYLGSGPVIEQVLKEPTFVQTTTSGLQFLTTEYKTTYVMPTLQYCLWMNNKWNYKYKGNHKLSYLNGDTRRKQLKYNKLRNGPRYSGFQHQLCWLWPWKKNFISRFYLPPL